jgi:hypothetical protein
MPVFRLISQLENTVWKNRRVVFSPLNEKRVGLQSDENTGDVASYGREFV